MAALKAAFLYFAIVFACGFAFGTARVLLVVPRVGELAAVLFEAPLMLLVSWFACGWAVNRFAVPRAAGARLAMGFAAFALLMVAELALSVWLFGRSTNEFFAGLRTPSGAVGLASQVVFGLLPLVRQRSH